LLAGLKEGTGAMTLDVVGFLAPRLRDELGFRVASSTRHHGGNNLLIVLVGEDGRRLMAKRYQPDDARHSDRLGREYRALAYLRSVGVDDVPRPFLRCDEYRVGVYSFEVGESRRADELTTRDAEHLAAFLLRVSGLGPPVDAVGLPPDTGGRPPPLARLEGYRTTVAQFRARATAPDALTPLRAAAASPLLERIDVALERCARAYADDPIATMPLPRAALRLGQGDCGPHNVLFRCERGPCFVDWEYAAWGDPAWDVAGFAHHVQSLGLEPSVRARFLEAYLAGADPASLKRLPVLLRLAELGWVVEHLAGTRPDRLRIGAETTPGFDPDAFVADHLRRCAERLAAYEEGYDGQG
jgi:aminoglycoside phosphotransferase (APT) family kinase protein